MSGIGLLLYSKVGISLKWEEMTTEIGWRIKKSVIPWKGQKYHWKQGLFTVFPNSPQIVSFLGLSEIWPFLQKGKKMV